MTPDKLFGQTLNGRYRILELLGIGGMGAVYRAYDVALSREVAIKVMTPAMSSAPEAISRFKRERKTVAGLEHPHIVPIYDSGDFEGMTYVAMRLLTGGSLADRLRRGRITGQLPSLGECATLLSQVAAALDYAHSKGVIHRDIKPANIMFDELGGAYVVDFGIAKTTMHTNTSAVLTETGQAVGTLDFISPEQINGQAVAASDQYSVGCMMYSVLTGSPVFPSDTPYELMTKHLNAAPPAITTLRSDVPVDAQNVINRALAKSPDGRFPSVTAFAQAFQAAIEGNTGKPTGFFSQPIPKRAMSREGVEAAKPDSTGLRRISQTFVQQRTGLLIGGVGGLTVAVIALLLILNGRNGTPGAVVADQPSATHTSAASPTDDPNAGIVPPTGTQTAEPAESPGADNEGEPTRGGGTEQSQAIGREPTAADTATPTEEPTFTDTVDPTATDTVPPTATKTHTATATEEPTFTDTADPTATNTISPTATETETATATEEPTFTDTAEPTATNTTRPTVDARLAARQTLDRIQTETAVFEQQTATANAIATGTQADIETAIALETEIAAQVTELFAAGLTETATLWTPTPTATDTSTNTPTPTDTPTDTATATHTDTFTPTATDMPTATNTFTQTFTPSPTSTDTATHTATHTPSHTPTETATQTPSATPTPTAEPDTVNIGAIHYDADTDDVTMRLYYGEGEAIARIALEIIEGETQKSVAVVSPQDVPETIVFPGTVYGLIPGTAYVVRVRAFDAGDAAISETFDAFTYAPGDALLPTITAVAEATRSAVPARVRVMIPSANLRIGPGTDYNFADVARQGDVLDVRFSYQRAGSTWYLVDLASNDDHVWEADEGWIRYDLVELLEGYDTAIIPTASSISPTPRPAIAAPTAAATTGSDATEAPQPPCCAPAPTNPPPTNPPLGTPE